MNEPKTCGSCGNSTKDDVCMIWDTGLRVTEAGTCSGWQPIPVATTDVKSNVPWHHMDGSGNEVKYPTREAVQKTYHYLVSHHTRTAEQRQYEWMLNMHDAIAKRDDLIQRMAEWMEKADNETQFWMRGKFHSLGDVQELLSEANELMGVK